MTAKNTGLVWGDWQTLINANQVNTGTNVVSAALDLAAAAPGVAACELSITAVYSAHAFVSGGIVAILRDIDGTNYETILDLPWQLQLPFGNAVTRYRAFSVDPRQLRAFKVYADCPALTSASITYTIRYRTATLQTQ
jgi:hypothetical protein